MDVIESFKMPNNLTLNILHDFDPENPRDWSNTGKLFLTDKHGVNVNELDSCVHPRDYNSWDELEEALIEENNVKAILPVYKYEHSGAIYNTTGFSCPWDSEQVGFIIATQEEVRQSWGWKRVTAKRKKKLEASLAEEIELYSQWASGQVYGFEVVNTDEEVQSSCWGFYGHDWKTNGLFDNAGYEETCNG